MFISPANRRGNEPSLLVPINLQDQHTNFLLLFAQSLGKRSKISVLLNEWPLQNKNTPLDVSRFTKLTGHLSSFASPRCPVNPPAQVAPNPPHASPYRGEEERGGAARTNYTNRTKHIPLVQSRHGCGLVPHHAANGCLSAEIDICNLQFCGTLMALSWLVPGEWTRYSHYVQESMPSRMEGSATCAIPVSIVGLSVAPPTCESLIARRPPGEGNRQHHELWCGRDDTN